MDGNPRNPPETPRKPPRKPPRNPLGTLLETLSRGDRDGIRICAERGLTKQERQRKRHWLWNRHPQSRADSRKPPRNPPGNPLGTLLETPSRGDRDGIRTCAERGLTKHERQRKRHWLWNRYPQSRADSKVKRTFRHLNFNQ